MTANIAKKILLVMGDVDKIEKTSAPTISYKFQAWDTIRAELRAACLKHGLLVIPHVTSHSYERIEQEGKTAQYQWNVGLKFDLIDPESGDVYTSEWSGEARDTSDKGLQKACTSGMKYWLLKTFQIADRDAAETDEAPAPETKVQGSINAQAPAKGKLSEPVQAWLKKHIVAADDSDEAKAEVADGRKALWVSFTAKFGKDAEKVLLGCDDLAMAQSAIKGEAA